MFERFRVVPIDAALADRSLRPFPPNVAEGLQQLLFSLDAPTKTAVIEDYYIDVDYSASYYDQRGRSFTPDKRGTTRFHFFSEELPVDALSTADPQVVKTMQHSVPFACGVRRLKVPMDIEGDTPKGNGTVLR